MGEQTIDALAKIAAVAHEAAIKAVRDELSDDVGDLELVVNVAWRGPGGIEWACGSAIPEPRPGSLLADSLAQTASEAEADHAT